MFAILNPSDPCGKYEVVSRAEWEAREPVSPPVTIPSTNTTFLHHTVTPHCTDKEYCGELVRSMQNYHIDDNGECLTHVSK